MLMAKSPSENSSHDPITPEFFSEFLSRFGLTSFGVFEFSEDLFRTADDAELGQSAILIGNVGSEMWYPFVQSAEYADSRPDPMNRWTSRIINELAAATNSKALYPFDKPYWPFQKFAGKALNVQPSPMGILIHREYGLWHAFRAVLVFDEPAEVLRLQISVPSETGVQDHPCDTCLDKPCLSSCPVGAIDDNGLNPTNCFSHLKTGSDPDCMKIGCEARNACPVGAANRYCAEQIQFHMKHYYKGRM